ncbi:hypothetical protein IX318_000238 [Porphyromonas levii]|nr:hypothetical protein [Porphyromonas levii]MBR8726941.1 hypothetical protein [Porphyromonas levii]MBR8805894.1 hypothetical protein [Porphyromonas levii]
MAKVQFISTNRKTAIGGAQFFISYWEKIGMSGLINKQLGKYSRIKTKFPITTFFFPFRFFSYLEARCSRTFNNLEKRGSRLITTSESLAPIPLHVR